jgi:D-alanine-D-alanine ligase
MPQVFCSNPKSVLSNLKIGVLAGGTSSERKISLRSGRAVNQALKRSGFRTSFIDPRNARKALKALGAVDLAFIALHGHGGEDGAIQSLLDRRSIPYIGSDAVSSRRAFDKAASKRVFQKKGIPTAPFVIVNARNFKKKLRSFPQPFFIKPVREGSSIGAFAVEDFAKMAEKIRQTAVRYGDLMAEKKLDGREFTVGVFGGEALPVVEMKPKREFYDYRAKYTKGMTDYKVPARIPAVLKTKMQKIALRVHKVLGLRDFSRVDIMTDRQGRPYVLEANSIPGFTELSLLPKAAKAAGHSFEDVCAQLVAWAYERGIKNGQEKKS